jgi:thiamine biosynthesis lipoprotein
METFEFRAMNTDILLAGQGERSRLAAGFEKVHDLIWEGEKRFSRFLEDSELSRLNRSAGTWFPASLEMFALLRLARRYHHMTGGLFDPSILPDLKRAGYDRSMDLLRAQPVVPADASGEPPVSRPAFGEMVLDIGKRHVLLPPGLSIDLGGIAKGWLAEQAAQSLSDYAEACVVNAGGDMYLFGHLQGSPQWPVALEDPREPGRTLSTVYVNSGGVATSSITRRAWRQSSSRGEVARHHLIDPRTGEPSQGDWLSVTVISAHTHLSEVFAKALLIAGPLEADRLVLTETSPFSYIAVDREGRLSGTHPILEMSHERQTQ